MRNPGWRLALLAALILLAIATVERGSARAQDQAQARLLFSASSFEPGQTPEQVDGWSAWSQREQTRPEFTTAELPSIGDGGSLRIGGASNSSAHGCWVRVVEGIEPGKYYRFEAWYTARAVPFPRQQVFSRLDWVRGDGGRAGQPEYVPETISEGGWNCNSGVFRAPDNAAAVELELYLSFAPQGAVWWDKISLSEVPPPAERKVRVATVNFQPHSVGDSRASVAAYIPYLEQAGRNGADIVCIGEGINMAGVSEGRSYSQVAEPIPGPATAMLGEVARKYGMYIIGALGELDGPAIYNTAVLIDREGRVTGKYRKVHLPREEIEAGVTPGNAYPVFDTDFGRIGMMICWDMQYVDPARALAVQGAEIIFCPIWGGNATLAKARAIENQTFLVTSAYSDLPTAIYGHWGELLAEATEEPSVIWTDLDLNATFPNQWLGDMRLRFIRERRADIKLPALEN